MAHHRRAVAAAAALNAGIFVAEAIAGYQASSLSLLMDSVHNLSDQLALVALWLAFILSKGPSRTLLRSANIFNSVGLTAVSGLLLWQAVERFMNPVPVQGIVPVIVGLAAAAANWGVARLLLKPSEHNAAIRLAYIHNLGDVWVSLAPVSAGLLLILTGYSIFDPLIAGGVAVWIIASTAREVVGSHDELIWPEKLVCCHTDHETTAVGARRLRSRTRDVRPWHFSAVNRAEQCRLSRVDRPHMLIARFSHFGSLAEVKSTCGRATTVCVAKHIFWEPLHARSMGG